MKIAVLAPLVTVIRPQQLGGSQVIASDLAIALTARGHDVRVFAANGSELEGVYLTHVDADPETLIDALYRPGSDNSLSTPALNRAFESAYRAIASEHFDIVHNHGFDPPAIRFSSDLPMPVIHTLHLPPTSQMTAAINELRRVRPIDKFVCVSRHQAERWREHVHIDAVIGNGVPVDRIPWSANPGSYLIYAGRMSPEKGAHLAIDIAKEAERPLVLAGPIYDESYFRSEVEPRLHGTYAIWVGAVTRARLWDLLSTSSAALLPVDWDEPFGLVAAEAQAAGSPVLCTKRGALSEVVEDGVSGFFIDPADLRAAGQWVRAAESLDRVAIRGRAKARLDSSTMVENYESLYEATISAWKDELISR